MCREREGPSNRVIHVLDPLPARPRLVFLRALLGLFGLKVREADFFAGHLHTADGESVFLSARRLAMDFSLQAARDLVRGSQVLQTVNSRFGRNTVLLLIARTLWLTIEQQVRQILVANTLSRPGEQVEVVLTRPVNFCPDYLVEVLPEVRVHFYGSPSSPLARARPMLTMILRMAGRLVKWRPRIWKPADVSRRSSQGHGGNSGVQALDGRPGLLLLQEDDLSMDRSYRTQPHWLFPRDGRQPFNTYVLTLGRPMGLRVDAEALASCGVFVLDDAEVGALGQPSERNLVYEKLTQEARTCIMAAFLNTSPAEAIALVAVWRLLMRARALAAVCERLRVKAFMTGESNTIDADAMQLIGSSLGIHTVACQYSNLGITSVAMLTTADTMLTFSSAYRKVWVGPGIRPGQFCSVGYLFDSSLALVRGRARERRAQLFDAGATFVLCYFDESVQHDKYGLISRGDHRADIRRLAELLLEDPSFALVVKSQFVRNLPSQLYPDDPMVARAKATGRYLELTQGSHRNIVFPAEAALIADMAIGHAIGATAALEAALAGVRCIVLNPYGFKSAHDDIYRQANIIYSSMVAGLAAISQYRAGEPAQQSLGDWSGILHHFDPYRDGQTAHRLRALLDGILGGYGSEHTPISNEAAGYDGESQSMRSHDACLNAGQGH